MSRKINLLGKQFCRLLVIDEGDRDRFGKATWICLCDCGNLTVVASSNLITLTSKSCGCLKTESVKTQSLKHGQNRLGKTTTEYRAWQSMKARCTKSSSPDYHLYGGRGISVCGRWLNSFENFFADMGKKPSKSHSLDRYPDVNGNYDPKNCRWATQKEQQSNRRDNVIIDYKGVRMIKADWARFFNIYPSQLHDALKKREFPEVFLRYANMYKNLNERLKQLAQSKLQ